MQHSAARTVALNNHNAIARRERLSHSISFYGGRGLLHRDPARWKARQGLPDDAFDGYGCDCYSVRWRSFAARIYRLPA